MNTLVKYLAIATVAATAWIGLENATFHHISSRDYEVTRGRITQVTEERLMDREKRVRFNIEYITGEKRACSRVVLDDKHMYGDSGWIASPNYREVSSNPLPTGDSIDVCCWGGGRMRGRCSFPGDSQYVGCMSEGKLPETEELYFIPQK